MKTTLLLGVALVATVAARRGPPSNRRSTQAGGPGPARPTGTAHPFATDASGGPCASDDRDCISNHVEEACSEFDRGTRDFAECATALRSSQEQMVDCSQFAPGSPNFERCTSRGMGMVTTIAPAQVTTVQEYELSDADGSGNDDGSGTDPTS